MSRNYKLFLNDILKAIEKVSSSLSPLTFEQFKEESILTDAILYNLQIIGEAVKNIPQDVKDKHPNVPWRKIAGFRDHVVHRYFNVNLTIVWEIYQNELPLLKPVIETLLNELPEEDE